MQHYCHLYVRYHILFNLPMFYVNVLLPTLKEQFLGYGQNFSVKQTKLSTESDVTTVLTFCQRCPCTVF